MDAVARIIYFAFLGLSVITLLVGIDVIDRTPESSFGFIIGFVSLSLLLYIIGWVARNLIGGSGSIRSKLETLKWTAMRRWGMLFRAIFISSLGIGGYFWLDPQPISDIPFSQLTLNQLFSNLFAFLLSVGCFCWFVNFPKQKKSPESLDDNPYVTWSRISFLFIFLAALIGLVIAVL